MVLAMGIAIGYCAALFGRSYPQPSTSSGPYRPTVPAGGAVRSRTERNSRYSIARTIFTLKNCGATQTNADPPVPVDLTVV